MCKSSMTVRGTEHTQELLMRYFVLTQPPHQPWSDRLVQYVPLLWKAVVDVPCNLQPTTRCD